MAKPATKVRTITHNDCQMFDISDQLRAIRQNKGLTQKELALKLGIDNTRVSNLENGVKVSRSTIDYYNRQSTDIFLEARNPMQQVAPLYKNVNRPSINFEAIALSSRYFSPEKGGSYHVRNLMQDLCIEPSELAVMFDMKSAGSYLCDKFTNPKDEKIRKVLVELLNIAMLSFSVFKNKEQERKMWLRLPNVDFDYTAPVLSERSKVLDYLRKF